MKKFYLLFLVLPFCLNAQDDCHGSLTEYSLNGNKVRAVFLPRGNKFYNDNGEGFLVPFPNEKKLSTIFASSPWLGGFDDAGNLKIATEYIANLNNPVYSPGPLTSIGTPYPDSICSNFDRAWTVFAEDIIRHKRDYYDDFDLDDTISSIFQWPGRGNPYSKQFNGFELPDTGNQGLAPFYDANANGIYNPEEGEIPTLASVIVPAEMMWMVFNHANPTSVETNGRPTRFEIQLLAYSFHCKDNELLNNTIYNKYRLINRATTALDSIYFGMFTDYDLGCAADDYVGSDSMRSSEFVYNADSLDGDNGGDCSTGSDTYAHQVPPVQSLTYLHPPMHSLIMYSGDADLPMEKYRLLSGHWANGSPIRSAGDGFDENPNVPTTRFLYHGDPTDVDSWAAINSSSSIVDVKTVSSVFIERMDPGSVRDVYLAYTFHYDTAANHLGQIQKMYGNLDLLNEIDPNSGLPCARYELCLEEDCVWPGDFNHNGRVDHEDYLAWGVFNSQSGAQRNGLVSWRGHYGDDWLETWEGIDAKHGDGDGNGVVDSLDFKVHELNHLLTNDDYNPVYEYPEGDDVVITATQGYTNGIKNFTVKAGRQIDNILGISFEIEYDTALFEVSTIVPFWTSEAETMLYPWPEDKHSYYPYARVVTDQSGFSMNTNFTLLRSFLNGFVLRPGKTAPDSTIFRLRNLKGIDPEGNDLFLGSEPFVIYRDGIVGTEEFIPARTSIYPNPTDGFIQIEASLETEAQLYSIQGHLVHQYSRNDVTKPIDVSSFSSGVYILKIMETGEAIKIIIQ